MRRFMFSFVIIIICFCSLVFAQEVPEKLLYITSNSFGENSLILLDLKSNKESKLFNKIVRYDYYSGKIAYIDFNKNFSLKVYDISRNFLKTIKTFDSNVDCDEPIWEDSSNILLTYKSSQAQKFSIYRINIDTGRMTDTISNPPIYKLKYDNSDLYIYEPSYTESNEKFKVLRGEKLIYESNDVYDISPSFINKHQISFSHEGNIYIYNLDSQQLNQFTDFSGNWDLLSGTGYGVYSWSKNGYLAVDFGISDDKKEIRIFSPDKKLIKVIQNGIRLYYPRWIENDANLDLNPSMNSLSIGQENLLTSDYAKYYHQFPGGKELSANEQQTDRYRQLVSG